MILPQEALAKHNSHCVYSGDQVLQNEALVAKQQNIAMYRLMENAGAAAFEQLKINFTNAQSILVLCGKGNNGGDGFIVARLAHLAKLQVTVLVTCEIETLQGDALLAYQNMITAGVTSVITKKLAQQLNNFQGDVIVDALFGIGFHGQLASQILQLVTAVNTNNTPVLSIDIPSGLCANTGFVNQQQAIVAQVTVTFIVYKLGLLTGQAANFTGKLVLANLALGTAFSALVSCENVFQRKPLLLNGISPLKKRLNTNHKGNIGQVLTLGGGKGMPGAIRLASEAALRCGAALVSVCCHPDNQAFIFNGRPELMFAPNDISQLAKSSLMAKAPVLVIGPGLGQSAWAQSLFNLTITTVLNNKKKHLIIDADALTFLAQTTQHCSRWVLTPHPKEAATLLNCDTATIEADRYSAVRAIANKYGGICVLKGAGTLISNGQHVVINSTGNAGMASGGMGDVLSGIIAALILQSEHYFIATCMAVYIHGAAGDIIADKQGQRGMLASDLFAYLPMLVNRC